jgi:DNA-binding response OmpR family regulator
MMPRIAVIEDDGGVRSDIVDALESQGLDAAGYPSADEFPGGPAAPRFDLIILDIMMPGTDGVAFCSEWRSRGNAQPIIFLSGKASDLDKVLALESGGDDYLTKPFSMIELLCRVRVCLRRAVPAPPVGGPSTGGLSFDDEDFRCWIGGVPLKLTVSEYRILAAASRSHTKVFTREELMRFAYPDDPYVSDRNADAHIKRIRRKLRDSGAPEGMIRTVYGLGYRFELP